MTTEECPATAHYCSCILDEGHDGAHVCDPGCGGSWKGVVGEDSFQVFRFPGEEKVLDFFEASKAIGGGES